MPRRPGVCKNNHKKFQIKFSIFNPCEWKRVNFKLDCDYLYFGDFDSNRRLAILEDKDTYIVQYHYVHILEGVNWTIPCFRAVL